MDLDFLDKILDDSDLQISGNAFARYFWYGIVVVIAIAAIFNLVQKTTLRLRYTHSHMVQDRGIDAHLMLESALQPQSNHTQLNQEISSPYP